MMNGNIPYRFIIVCLSVLLTVMGCDRIDLIGFSQSIPLTDGVHWSNHQLAIDIGSEGEWDVNNVRHAGVIKEDDLFKMWYSGSSAGTTRIIYADSKDGKSWSNFEKAIDVGNVPPYDTANVLFASIIKDWFYRMWYTGSASLFEAVILYCESLDGVNWTEFQLVVDLGSEGTYDVNYAWAPCVIKDGDLFKMWYAGSDESWFDRILYCESKDGKKWDNYQLVVDLNSMGGYDEGSCSTPMVIKDGGLYKMWYTGSNSDVTDNAIIYCESEDGINWSNFQLSMEKGEEGVYDTVFAIYPTVINDRGVGRMWYRGSNEDKGTVIYCESE